MIVAPNVAGDKCYLKMSELSSPNPRRISIPSTTDVVTTAWYCFRDFIRCRLLITLVGIILDLVWTEAGIYRGQLDTILFPVMTRTHSSFLTQ
jgi:hypothetical protein